MNPVARLVGSIPRSPTGWLFEGTARPSAVIWASAVVIAVLLLTAPALSRPENPGSRFRGRRPDIQSPYPVGGVAHRGVNGRRDAGLHRHRRPAGLAHRPHRPAGPRILARGDHAAAGAPLVHHRVRPSRWPWDPAASSRVGWRRLSPRSPLPSYRIPSIYGFPGAAFTLIIISFPYVLLPIRAALWNMDTSLEESARALGPHSVADLPQRNAPNAAVRPFLPAVCLPHCTR